MICLINIVRNTSQWSVDDEFMSLVIRIYLNVSVISLVFSFQKYMKYVNQLWVVIRVILDSVSSFETILKSKSVL